jgi:hypothetical protein
MDADQSPKWNPYAPSSFDVDESEVPGDSFPEAGIDFAGTLDLRSVRKTKHASLACGTIVALSFSGLLLVAALIVPAFSSAVLVIAALLTALTLFAFMHGQTQRPLLKFDWMQGPVDGTLRLDRLDIRWNDGESAGSLGFPANSNDLDFVNRHGRLFVLRGMPCFIPHHALPPGLLRHVKLFRPQPARSAKLQLRQPPGPTDETAIVWPASMPSFSGDLARHAFLCADPGFSRTVCLLGIAIVALLWLVDSLRPPMAIVTTSTVVAMAGLCWVLREGMRRDWWSTNIERLPAIRWSKPGESPPDYARWIDQHRLLIGFCDAWICVPWSAVNRARISPHAIEFSFTPLGLDAWYLERGDHSEQQWRSVIEFVQLRTNQVTRWGTARR